MQQMILKNCEKGKKKLLEEKQIKVLEEKINQLNEGKEIFYRHLAQYTVASLVKDAEQIQIRWQTEVDAGGQQEKTR